MNANNLEKNLSQTKSVGSNRNVGYRLKKILKKIAFCL